MKVTCPVCETSYNLREERLTKPVVRAACKKCGNTLVITKDTGEVETAVSTPSPSEEPRHISAPTPTSTPTVLAEEVEPQAQKDYVAIAVVIAVLLLLAGVGYYLVSNSSKGFLTDSGKAASKQVKGSNRFEVCKSFVLRDTKLSSPLGKDVELTILSDQVKVSKGKEFARLIIRAQGSKGSKNLKFLLLKEKEEWRVISVKEEQRVEKATSRPRGNLTKSPVEPRQGKSHSSTPPHGKEASQRRTSASLSRMMLTARKLPSTTTNEALTEFVHNNPGIQALRIDRCSQITDISPLADLKSLSVLSMTWCTGVSDISPLSNLKGLKLLYLHKCDSLRDLTPLKSLRLLVVLSLPPTTTNGQLADVIPRLPRLETLSINSCYQVTDVSPVANLKDLTRLSMDHAHKLVDISPLAELTGLQMLHLTYTQVQDLTPVGGLSDLNRLWLWGNRRVLDISPLENLTNLTLLGLNGCKGVYDISPLSELTQLRSLSLSRLEKVDDVSSLSNLKQLKKLDLRGCSQIPNKQIQGLKRALPSCQIQT